MRKSREVFHETYFKMSYLQFDDVKKCFKIEKIY